MTHSSPQPTASTEPSSSETRLPDAVDYEIATRNGAYAPWEVIEDASLFGDWIADNTWVVDTVTGWPYLLTAITPRYTCRVLPGTQLHPSETSEVPDPPSTDDSRVIAESGATWSVTDFSALLESGRLCGVPAGRTIHPPDSTIYITNTGTYFLITTTADNVTSPRDISFPAQLQQIRYTDGAPGSVLTPADEQELISLHNSSNADTFAYTVNGNRTGVLHLLPCEPGEEKAFCEPASPVDQSQSPVSADGGAIPGQGTIGVNPSIQSVPYFPAEDPEMVARFVPTSRHVAETFQEPNLRRYALNYMDGRVLNACAGPTDLGEWYDGEIVRNDLHPDVESDVSVDVAELACEFPESSFDTIVFDPPWTTYQSRMRYDGFVVHKTASDDLPVQQINIDVRDLPFTVPGEYAVADTEDTSAQLTLTNDTYSDTASALDGTRSSTSSETPGDGYVDPHTEKDQLGHARLAKLGFDYLLRDGGRVIQLAYTGSVMPAALDYTRVDRTAFDPTGTYKTLIGGVDQKQ